jgi:hypothetical protein
MTMSPKTEAETTAERLRFSDAVIKILPLADGNFALYGAANEIVIVTSPADLGLIAREVSDAATAYGRQQKARFAIAGRVMAQRQPQRADVEIVI